MKRKLLLSIIFMLLVSSVTACGNGKNRYGEDPDFNDMSIYKTKWAEEEIATWEDYSWVAETDSSMKGRFRQDEITFQIDGHIAKFPACASKTVENPVEPNFEDRMFVSGTERMNRYAYMNTENSRVVVVVDNNSGRELYQGEMACYRMEIEALPKQKDNFKVNILGVEVTKATKASDVIAVLGEPYDIDKSMDLKYQFEKGMVEFCFDKTYENGDFESINIYAKGWEN